MHDVVLFNGLNTLDFNDIRKNVIRIPEVSARIFEAQKIWDSIEETSSLNFYNFLSSENETYLGNIKLKSLAASIIQVGLYDRYVRKFGRPRFLVGSTNGDSPMQVCLGTMTFEDMVIDSHAGRAALKNRPISIADGPVLTGICLSEFGVYQFDDLEAKYQLVDADKVDVTKIILELIEEHQAKTFINIGPGNVMMNSMRQDLALREVEVLESIEVDPMLNWFWSSMRRSNHLSLAQ